MKICRLIHCFRLPSQSVYRITQHITTGRARTRSVFMAKVSSSAIATTNASALSLFSPLDMAFLILPLNMAEYQFPARYSLRTNPLLLLLVSRIPERSQEPRLYKYMFMMSNQGYQDRRRSSPLLTRSSLSLERQNMLLFHWISIR
jgi:hypothetical protein